MTPDKAQKISNDLANLAASIVAIAEEIKQHSSEVDSKEPKPLNEAHIPEPVNPKAPTLEVVRGILADKASHGFNEAVQALIKKHGVSKLSEVDSSAYATLIKEAEELK
ncbi:MAG: hypothetical protein A2Y17_11355 [Clostridiales bacterium GWF2_38_85]|nr:MAG: hypothetical protein A2Y17_11355 [Clostridiales bacterium GWF2_38_85]HBL84721.1 rRNA biogenesis protein rrp5 [Clostridiales bacterium]